MSGASALVRLAVLGVVLIAAGFAGWAIRGPAPKLELDLAANTSQADKAVAQRAASILTKTCPGLVSAAKDVVTAKIHVTDAYPYQADQYGWARQVIVEIALDGDVNLPLKYSTALGVRQFDGHRIRFMVGVDRSPGVIVEKAQGAALCDQAFRGDANFFIPAAAS